MSQRVGTVTPMWFPTACERCAAPGPSPCGRCLALLTPAPALEPPPGLDSLGALVAYDDAARPFVAALKYRNRRASVGRLAGGLAALLPGSAPGRPAPVLTWAPTTPERRRHRGYDQARLLAHAVARSRAVPCRRLLVRRPGPHQTGRSRAERLSGVELVAVGQVPTDVVVVDDVCTTGATLSAAAAALRAAGADRVHGLVLARTPSGAPVGQAAGAGEGTHR